MTGYLFDTSSLSLLAPGRSPPPETAGAVRREVGHLFLPTIAVAEIETGLRKLDLQGSVRRAGALRDWLDRLTGGFGNRILAFDLPAARCAGELSDAAAALGRHPGFADVAIAAIARSRGLLVLTENRRHFDPLSVESLSLSDFVRTGR